MRERTRMVLGRPSWIGLAAAVGVLVLAVAAGVGAGQQDYKLMNIDGNTFRLADHKGEAVYVSFWATWCVPCRRELPLLESMYSELKDRGLVVVGVNTDPAANKSKIKPFASQYRFTFPTVLDPDNNVHDTYNPSRELPYGLLIDRAGNLHKTYAGYHTGDEELHRADIMKLLGGTAGTAATSAGESGAAGNE